MYKISLYIKKIFKFDLYFDYLQTLSYSAYILRYE